MASRSGLHSAEQSQAKSLSISSKAKPLNLSTPSLMPRPNSALSSKRELDQAGPRPSARWQYGVVGRLPP